MNARVVADGLIWPEGPAVLEDGRVAFVETYASRISVWTPGKQGSVVLADTGGGPNAVCPGFDGYLYVTNNGGTVGAWRAENPTPGCIQRVSIADGSVEVIATEIDGVELRLPNDLAFGPDGRLYFTDPGLWNTETKPDPGHIFALGPDGTGELLAELEPVFPNGLVVEADGGVVWAESYTRQLSRLGAGGAVEAIAVLEQGAVPDGLAVAADGSLWVSALTGGGIRIVGKDGAAVRPLDVGAVPSNCCFGGHKLYVTDGGSPDGTAGSQAPVGLLWEVDAEVAGMPLFPGHVEPAPARS